MECSVCGKGQYKAKIASSTQGSSKRTIITTPPVYIKKDSQNRYRISAPKKEQTQK